MTPDLISPGLASGCDTKISRIAHRGRHVVRDMSFFILLGIFILVGLAGWWAIQEPVKLRTSHCQARSDACVFRGLVRSL